MERIERETEIHRTQKAIKRLLGQAETEADILFPESKVQITIPHAVLEQSGGQLCLALLVNLLGRMKAIISQVAITVPADVEAHEQVPLANGYLRAGLEQLVSSLSGPDSKHSVVFDFTGQMAQPTVTVAFDSEEHNRTPADIIVGADSWTAYINASTSCSGWTTRVPVGPHVAATLAATEIFKRLLLHNFPNQTRNQIKLAEDVSFSALNYANPPEQTLSLPEQVELEHVAIVGVGAGGSAALYTLACFPQLTGEITLVEPGNHKESNLARYLLSNYEDCHRGSSKIRRAYTFLQQQQPLLAVQMEPLPYEEVNEPDYRLVISTVDTPESRWAIQHDWPPVVLDAAVIETIYAVLRVYPGEGICLGCKHPYDPDITWKRRAMIWGKKEGEVRQLHRDAAPVTEQDITTLAQVQNQPVENFRDLIGIPFNEVPALTECGDTHFDLQVPNQVATLPFQTTMAGVLLAAEVIKDRYAPEWVLSNWFEHNMLWVPKPQLHRFRRRLENCAICREVSADDGSS